MYIAAKRAPQKLVPIKENKGLRRGLIPSLNGLRAISIFMVLGYHFDQHGFLPKNNFFKIFSILFFNGPLGVNVFFIISGFLITTLLISEKEKNGNVSLRDFYIRRSIRIFPAYYVFVLFLLGLQGFKYLHLPLAAWLAIITYTKQFFPFYDHIIEHLWSLSVEEFFYFLWPICFLKIKKTPLFILTAISIFVCMRFALFQYPLARLTNTIFTTGDALLVGCFIAIRIEFFKALLYKYTIFFSLTPLFIFLSICVHNYLFHLGPGLTYNDFGFLLILQKTTYALFGGIGVFTNILVGLFVVYCIFIKGLFFRFLNSSLMNYIGLLSYSIYLWQQIFTDDREWLHQIPLPLIIILIFATALISFYSIEKPFIKLRQRFKAPVLR